MKNLLTMMLTLSLLAGLLPLGTAAQEDPVKKLVREMSLEDKIAQMLMMEFRHWDEDPADDVPRTDFTVMNPQVRKILADYHFGAVILFAQNLTGTEQSFYLARAMQEAAINGGGLPMLISADQEGGSVFRLATGTALPGNMALGAAGDTEYARLAGSIIGSELSVLGINTNLAPVVDVNSNAANPVIGLRAFSDDPETVGSLASAVIAGMAEHHVIGCAKHFPGHGDTATDSHYGLPVVDKSLETLLSCELVPYKIAIDHGVEMIMTAHILYPQLEGGQVVSRKTGKAESLPATMSDDIITGLLKQDMGFQGIVVTDAMNMAGVADHWDSVQAVVLSIQAGADMICMPCSLSSMEDLEALDAILEGVAAAVEDGTIPIERIDDAVSRILTVKKNRGILDWKTEDYSPEKALAIVGCENNREAERMLAAAAVTVVKNKNNTLPLRLTGDSRVLMMVPYDNEKAQMILGWNRAAEAGLIPEGAQVRAVRFDAGTTLDTFLEDIRWADTIILNSEISSAGRMNGGRWESAYILQVIGYAKNNGKTTVVQSVDKPYDVQSYPDADAVLAVYGCKGSSLDPTQALLGSVTGTQEACGPNIIAGIEVLFGVFGAEGTLPVDIPRYSGGSYTQELVFSRGYGLHYDSLLPEPEPETLSEPETQAQIQTVPVTAPARQEAEEIREPFPKIGLWAALAAIAGGVLLKCRSYKPRYRRKK